ncbi:4'-phosphopantetheinyl transferase superfamily protein [Synechococcus sp. J7-Johnson]|uniref:4'-phosphopantetheinyl transferase family protein n=1 Tax=Synechococcus sp. J7-Johnson TaxID=2823737 RepID=UPI0020CBB6D7|nr:4'-phosphopantetheinyl transferase superfamily protein [Synechococcus sp. J7-Johnson]MCP9841562.1 4'-phosphopantetheinyl transferase superfamily protein [Synechococcus sp. J7-Johnson]
MIDPGNPTAPSDPEQAAPRRLEHPGLPATVWLAGLGWLTPQRREELLALLSSEEQQRLQRWRLPADQDRFLLGRGLLRLRLGQALGLDPARLRFRLGPQGKPALEGLESQDTLQFNLAHSGALMLLAFHPERPVGVDVEQHRPGLNWQPIARRHLPNGCLEALEALPPEEQLSGFLQHWCRLEASLKATGLGLAAVGAPPPPGLELHDLHLPEGYAGSLAVI